MNLFTDSKLVYEGRKSLLSELEIRQLLEITGDKINSFIQFYQTYDGVFFPKQAMMFRNKFYSVAKADWDRIEIGFFLKIENIITIRKILLEEDNELECFVKTHMEEEDKELECFVKTHIPFADDGCGNGVWIEISTGIIKAFYHEYSIEEGLIEIAPNFNDFCSSLENWTLK